MKYLITIFFIFYIETQTCPENMVIKPSSVISDCKLTCVSHDGNILSYDKHYGTRCFPYSIFTPGVCKYGKCYNA